METGAVVSNNDGDACYIYINEKFKASIQNIVFAGKAVQWYRKAAKQGNAHGQFNLATMYDKGRYLLTSSILFDLRFGCFGLFLGGYGVGLPVMLLHHTSYMD